MQLRLGGSRRDAEHLGDLLVLVTFDIVQREHTSGALRQSREEDSAVEDALLEQDGPDAEPLLDAAVDPAPSPTFAVASTGVIDIIPFAGDPATDADEDGLALDADPDVEALGAIDAELEDPNDADDPQIAADDDDTLSGDRPWEKYVKTDADLEADAFFASFTAEQAERAAAQESDGSAAGEGADADGPAADEGNEQR